MNTSTCKYTPTRFCTLECSREICAFRYGEKFETFGGHSTGYNANDAVVYIRDKEGVMSEVTMKYVITRLLEQSGKLTSLNGTR